MTLNISTPLADKWDRVPEKYKKLVNEGKMTYQEAFKYAEEAPRTSSVQPSSRSSEERGARKSLDITEQPPKGNAVDDAALALRTGTNTATSGVVGTPVALFNAIVEPKWVGQISQAAEDITGRPVPNAIQMGRALLDDNNKAGILDTMTGGASPEAYGARTIQQPDAVRGIQESLDISSEKDVKDRGSNSLQKGLSEINNADSAGDAVRALIHNPKLVPYLAAQQVPNLVINRIPGSTAGTITAQAFNAGASADSQVYQALSKEVEAGRMTRAEAEKRAAEAGSRSTAINLALPSVFGDAGRVTERLLAGQVAKEVAKDAIKKSVIGSAAKAAAINAVEEGTTEGLEQVSQNVGTGDPLLKGVGANAVLGAATGMAFGGPAAGIETAIQNTQVAEHQKVLAEFDKQQKELEAKHTETQDNNKISEELKKQADAVAEGKAPVIQDLFTSEAIPAEQVAAKAEAALAQNTAEATNPETAPTIPRSPEQQMEVDNRVVDTLKKQEAGKAKEENKTVNTLVTEELAKREQVKQAEDIVKNKYDIVNVQDIAQEANQRMKAELDAIAQSPGNRTAEGQKLLPEILARREALRLPEIKEQVKNERLAKVEQAASFLKQEEEAQVRKEVETKVAKEQAVSEPTQATLPMKYPQQPQPKARGYTGTMTPEQKVAEAKDMAFKKELASLPPEQAKVLLEETNKAEKAAVAQEKKQEKAKTAAYMAAKSNARSSIAAEVSSSMPEADGKTKAQEIGRRMLEWSTKNPEEKFVLPEVRKATTVTQKIAAKEKAKETKVSRAVAGKEQKNAEKVYEGFKKEAEASGLAPKEARAQALEKLTKHLQTTDSNEALPKEAEATLRESLGQKKASQELGGRTSDTMTALSSSNIGIGQSGVKIGQQFATAKEAAAYLVDNGSTDKIKQLATLAARIISKYNVPITYAKAGDKFSAQLTGLISSSYGVVVREAGSDRVSHLYFNTTAEGYNTEEVVLHELLHVALADAIKDPANAAIVQQLESVRKEMLSEISDTMLTDGRSMSDVRKLLANVDELVSVSQTNPYFMEIVQRMAADGRFYSSYRTPADMKSVLEAKPAALPIPVKPTLSLWKKLASLFAKLLGIPNNYVTAYREQLENYNSIIANNIKAGKFGEDKFIPLASELDRLVKALADSVDTSNPSTGPEAVKPLSEYNQSVRARVQEDSPGFYSLMEESLGTGHQGLVDTLEYMADTDSFDRGYSLLAKRLLPIVKRLGMDFKDSSESSDPKAGQYRGFYDPNTDTIYMTDYSPETLLHETIHAITWHVLNGKGPFGKGSVGVSAKKLVSQFKGLQFQLNAHITKNFDKFSPTQKEFIETARSVENPGMLENVDELLSYGFTSPIGQRILSMIPATGKIATTTNNALKSFISSIKDFMGISDKTVASALDDVLTLGEDVLKFAEENVEDVARAVAEVKNNYQAYLSKANEEAPSDKPRPVLTRTGRVLTIKGRNNGIFTIKGRDIKILNHGTAENMLGVIQDALTSGHGFSANVTESLSVAQGLIGEYLQRAKARFDTIENSLKEVATKTKAPLTQVQEEFTKAVGTFEQAEGDAKTSISNSLVRNYGDAARAYFANRAEIDSLTDMIIQERLKNPEPFTSKEAAIYGKMKQELGKYYTRSYASDLKGVEETYAKSMIDAYNAKQKGTATEHQKVLAATMEAAIDTIHNTFVLIPDADVLANSSLDKLRTLAATWNLKVAENDDMSVEDKKDAFIEALDSFREDKQHLDTNFTNKRAVALATELLKDIEGSPIVSYLKGARADRTVVEARENIPPSIRKFLGEYEDVALKGLTTILKQAQFIFQTKALGEILTSEQDKGANSKILSVEEFTEKGYSTEDWKKATGESFGPLQGMYIEESLYNRLQELRDVNTPLTTFLQRDDVNPIIQAVVGSTVNGWMKSMSLIKQGQLVFNPVNAAYNLLGGPNILLSNGAFGKNGIKNVRKAMDTALSLIAAQGPTSVVHPEVSRMIRTNQVDSAYLGSLRGSEMDKVRDLLLAQLGETEPSLLTKGLRKSKERLTQTREIYAMMDVVWKIAAFYHRVDVLTEFDKLNGVERSPEAVDRQAAADNSAANFSYSHVPKFVKAIEKFGPSYILPFVTESFRAPFSSMLLGISDIKRAQHALTPEAKSYLTQQGAKRALGAFTAMTTAGMIMHAGLVGMSKLIGDDDEDKDQKLIEKLRPFMAPYEKFDDFFVAGKDSKGNPVLVNFNRTDPFDTVSRLTRMIAQDATADEYETYFKNLFITNKRAASLLDAVMSAGQENDGKVAKNTRMENFYRPDFIPKDWPSIYESLSSVAGPKTVKAIDGILPSWLARSMDSRNEVLAPNGTVSKALGVDVFSATVKYGGGQLTTVDINKSLKFAVIDYDKEKKAAAEQLKSILSTSEVLTKEEYAKAWVEATHQEKEAFNKLAEKFSGLQSLGYSGEEAAKYLVGAGMDKKVVHSLMQGTYRPENSLLISQASRDALKKDIEADTSPQKAKRARNYNASLEAIKEYNLPVRSK